MIHERPGFHKLVKGELRKQSLRTPDEIRRDIDKVKGKIEKAVGYGTEAAKDIVRYQGRNSPEKVAAAEAALETAGRSFDRQTADRDHLERELIIAEDAHGVPAAAVAPVALKARKIGGSR